MTNESNQPHGTTSCSTPCVYHQVSRIFTGLVIIWLGISFLLENEHYFRHGEWWAYFIFGLGILFLAEAIVCMLYFPKENIRTGKMIAGAVLIAISASHIYGLDEWWPLIIIAVGVIIILSNLNSSKKNEQ